MCVCVCVCICHTALSLCAVLSSAVVLTAHAHVMTACDTIAFAAGFDITGATEAADRSTGCILFL